jgi:hypothetical protein
MIIATQCTKVYGRYRTYYIHTPWCRAAGRLAKRLGRTPSRVEIEWELSGKGKAPAVRPRKVSREATWRRKGVCPHCGPERCLHQDSDGAR